RSAGAGTGRHATAWRARPAVATGALVAGAGVLPRAHPCADRRRHRAAVGNGEVGAAACAAQAAHPPRTRRPPRRRTFTMTTLPMPPALDADIVDQLHDAFVPEPMDAALAARV